MKIIKLLSLLLIMSFPAFSQNIKELTLEIKDLENDTGYCGNVYVKTDNGISQPYSCENGNVQIIFTENPLQIERTFITIRQNNTCVANINMKCLLSSNAPIKLPKMSVEVKKFIDITTPTEISEVLKLLPNGIDESKLKPDLKDDSSFFPKRVFRKANDRTKYLANWFAWQLQFLNEHTLCDNYPNNVYRLTWISNQYSYEYDPYSVRIEMQKDGFAILFCNYYCSEEKGRDKINCDIISLDSQSIEQFMQKVNDLNVKDEVFTTGVENNSILYSFEYSINGQYHVIFRGEGEDPALDELQKFLWSLTRLGENKIVHKRQRIE